MPEIWCYALLLQSCLTLCNPMGCSPPDFSVHEILQARILEWVAIPFSRGSSQPRDQTQVSCIAGRLLESEFSLTFTEWQALWYTIRMWYKNELIPVLFSEGDIQQINTNKITVCSVCYDRKPLQGVWGA